MFISVIKLLYHIARWRDNNNNSRRNALNIDDNLHILRHQTVWKILFDTNPFLFVQFDIAINRRIWNNENNSKPTAQYKGVRNNIEHQFSSINVQIEFQLEFIRKYLDTFVYNTLRNYTCRSISDHKHIFLKVNIYQNAAEFL